MTVQYRADDERVIELTEQLFADIRKGEAARQSRIADLENRLSKSTADNFRTTNFANLRFRADGMRSFAVVFVTDGRKDGEAAGEGTGVPVWYNAATDQWLRFSDDTAVAN